jgi:capsid protein
MNGRIANVDIERRKGYYSQLGYRSVRMATREGLSATPASGEMHEVYDRPRIINQSRQFMRDNAIYKGMIERCISYIVGNGFEMQAKTANPAWNQKAEKLWKDFRRRPEIRGVLSGAKLDRMICREMLVAGDTALIKTNKGLLQHIEAEQIAGKGLKSDGIRKGTYGNILEFSVCKYDKNGFVDKSNPISYKPEFIMFLTDPERPSSTRGVPPCQASFPMLHRINDVCDSEAIAWQLLARIAVAVISEAGDEVILQKTKEDPDRANGEGQLTTRLTELDYALMFFGKPGEEIKGIEHNIPGMNFSESLRMFLRLLGLPLGLPLELILLDWTQSNYSQSRAVLEQAYTTFLDKQETLEDFYYVPTYEWKVTEWIDDGLLTNRKDAFEHEWIKPTFPWIDQLKEVEAYGEKVDRTFSTHAQVCKSLNRDRTEIVDAAEREVRDAIERAKKIKTDTGTDVPWEIFCGRSVKVKEAKTKDVKEEKKDKNNE